MTKHLCLGIGITAVLTAGFVMLVVVGFRQRDRFVARYLVSRTAKISDRDLTSHLRRLAHLGPEGMPGLVDSLASGRPAEREAALVVLEEVVAREFGTNAESLCLQRLTRSLATLTESLSERSREAALRWTYRIVAAQYRSGRRNPTVLADCQRIQEARPSEPSSVPFLASSDSGGSARATQSAERTVTDTRNRVSDVGAPKGSNVFAQSSQDPVPVDSVEESSDATEKAPSPEEPARLPALADAGLDTIPEPAEIPNNSVEVVDSDNAILNAAFGSLVNEHLAKSEGPIEVGSGPSVRATSVSSELPTTSSSLQAELRRRPDGLSDRDLLTLLHHDETEVSGWAENELRRRNISPEEIALGRLIAHPDPGVRQRLARGLPKMPKVDRVVWLLELSHDSHPAVRLAALRSMAEFDDAQLEARADEMAEQDSDESVRQRARRLVTRREGAGFTSRISSVKQISTAPESLDHSPTLIEVKPPPQQKTLAEDDQLEPPLPPSGQSITKPNGMLRAESIGFRARRSAEQHAPVKTTRQPAVVKKSGSTSAPVRGWRPTNKKEES